MNFYSIIQDKNAFVNFINWLPDLQENEKFYLSLFARKKYCPELIKSNDKTQLKRFLSDKERMYDKVKQLEIQLGDWKLKNVPAPQESLVLYINPNPRCMKKATEAMGKKCWDLIRSNNYNLHAEAMSCIQKSKSRSVFVDFDIDEKEGIDFSKMKDILPNDAYNIVETRGGYHLLVNVKAATFAGQYTKWEKNWHRAITNTFPIDQQGREGDQLLPVPGCMQGGFVPKFF